MSIAYIGIGSNLGDRRLNCIKAIEALEDLGMHILKRSSMHETKPWGMADQPKFINMALEVETGLAPIELLRALKCIEKNMGRKPEPRWGPRVIDLDILLYDDLILDDDTLVIPHPHMHERAFVLKPLSEIAPEKLHPLLLKKIRVLLHDLQQKAGLH
ncbi:MAG: 2-amino-4-hydroxy-6-hydroxymethyldihydropteridine diphosphokinase [Nitrospirae bacterium]|nr:2-amino-4-hydroxy-6-hydroxymethyldihydropteridine diphosphokinase [Nitrospirota bacterium]